VPQGNFEARACELRINAKLIPRQKALTDTVHTDTPACWGYDICEIRTDTAAALPASQSASLPAFERPSGVQEIVGQRLQMNAKRWKANNRKKAIS